MLIDDLLGGVLATAAAHSHRELGLNFEKRAGTVLYDFANLTISHTLANAHVHIAPASSM